MIVKLCTNCHSVHNEQPGPCNTCGCAVTRSIDIGLTNLSLRLATDKLQGLLCIVDKMRAGRKMSVGVQNDIDNIRNLALGAMKQLMQ